MRVIMLVIGLLLPLVVYSGDKAEEEKQKNTAEYYRMYPDFVTNLNTNNTLTYVLIRVELAANGKENLQLVKDNEALLRDKIILLLNGKNKQDVARGENRKALKKQALLLIQETMTKETGKPIVTNLLFTKFQVE